MSRFLELQDVTPALFRMAVVSAIRGLVVIDSYVFYVNSSEDSVWVDVAVLGTQRVIKNCFVFNLRAESGGIIVHPQQTEEALPADLDEYYTQVLSWLEAHYQE